MLEVGPETDESSRKTTLTRSFSSNYESTNFPKKSKPFDLQDIPVIPMWAMGKERCNMCDFRSTFQTILEDHIQMKHLVIEHQFTTTIIPSESVFPLSAVGSLQCSQCNFAAKYLPLLAQHQQTEDHGFVDLSNLPLEQSKSPETVLEDSVTQFTNNKIKKNLTLKVKSATYEVTKEINKRHNKMSKIYLDSIEVCIRKAIESSEKKMMTSPEIFKYFEKNFQEKVVKTKDFKNQIRRNLSVKDCFYKVRLN